jgi:hypothetical protein
MKLPQWSVISPAHWLQRQPVRQLEWMAGLSKALFKNLSDFSQFQNPALEIFLNFIL